MPESYFTSEDAQWFQPTDYCRGPWDPQSCHAGPPTGMIARAAELLVPGQQLARLSLDLSRAVPMSGFRIEGQVLHSGRTLSTASLALIDSEGRTCVSAKSMHIAPGDFAHMPTADYLPPEFETASDGPFPIRAVGHSLTAFRHSVQLKYPPGQTGQPGSSALWMRCLPLLDNEQPSPFQRICPLADCGNAFSRNAEPGDVSFINTDLTIMIHRPPDGDWLGMQSTSRWENSGIGVSDATLFDRQGAVGKAIQTLILRPSA